MVEPCIDQYLFALYERTPKEDTIKEIEKRQGDRQAQGQMVTVTRSFTKLVENDFTWKDPKAAERVGMSMSDYVIGGMDRSFKLKLFHMLYAAEAAGLRPGITSAFRDDYRQGIASGLKAASNRSFHGGSLRGGYGRGLAADIVSVNGANRAQRWASTEILWKWVDANGKQFGVGRPYLKYDIPTAFLAAAWPAVNGYFFLPTYGTLIAAINFDRSGTTGIGKYILNHSFMLPGLIATITGVVVGLVIAKVVF